jgi:hypothetical protein
MFNEYDRGHLVKLDDGSFVERDVLNVVEKIAAYDPNIKVQYLAYAANIGEAPWRIVELCKDGQWRTVFYCWSLDGSVLERLYAADTQKHNVLGRLDSNNDGVRKEQYRRYKEKFDAASDIVASMLRSPKGRWSFTDGDKKVTVDDDPTTGPAKVERLES